MLAPWSAGPTAARMLANSSRPVPTHSSGVRTWPVASRACSSVWSMWSSSVPVLALSVIRSPLRIWAIGPPAAASGGRGGEAGQLGHAVGGRSLVAQHGHQVAVEVASVESGEEVLLVVENPSRCGDHPMLGLYRGHFDDTTAQVPTHGPQPTIDRERVGCRAQSFLVETVAWAVHPRQGAVPE